MIGYPLWYPVGVAVAAMSGYSIESIVLYPTVSVMPGYSIESIPYNISIARV